MLCLGCTYTEYSAQWLYRAAKPVRGHLVCVCVCVCVLVPALAGCSGPQLPIINLPMSAVAKCMHDC